MAHVYLIDLLKVVIFQQFLLVYQRLIRLYLVGGVPTPLKNMKVNWDDDIPNIWKNKSHVPNHQSDIVMKPGGLQLISMSFWVFPNSPFWWVLPMTSSGSAVFVHSHFMVKPLEVL